MTYLQKVKYVWPAEESLVRAQSGPLHFRFPIFDVARCGFSTRICHPAVYGGPALKALLKTENKRTAPGRSRGTVRALEMRKRKLEFVPAPVAKPDDQ